MSELQRISMTIENELAEQFDALLKKKGYSNRSEAIRDLIRRELVSKQWEADDTNSVGTLTIVYDHSKPDLARRLLKHGHKEHSLVKATLHIHLDHDNCLEVMALQGRARDVKKFSEIALGAKGVKHGKLVMTTMGLNL